MVMDYFKLQLSFISDVWNNVRDFIGCFLEEAPFQWEFQEEVNFVFILTVKFLVYLLF